MELFGVPVQEILLRIPALLMALTFHEVAHGYVAMRLGDPTAKSLGRLSLNPLKHIDPIGALCMLLFRFGWAKPVPINTRYFKNPKRDMALSAAAGPASNFIMAFAGVLIFYFSAFFIGFRGGEIEFVLETTFLDYVTASVSFAERLGYVWLLFLQTFIFLNLSFGVFNLIPVPPLDGSRIFLQFLPAKYYFAVMKYEQYIMLGLMLLLWTGIVSLPLSKIVIWILDAFEWIVRLIPLF